MQTPKNIGIVGGGLMGAGIAQVFAVAGHHVTVFDTDEATRSSLQKRVEDNLTSIDADPGPAKSIMVVAHMEEAVGQADFVTEAVSEVLSLKRKIFTELVKLSPANAVLASNTSVIPITKIAEGITTPERIVGTHWWNPPYLVPLVEVVQAENTSNETIEFTMRLLASVGKSPAHVKKDLPGFIANRLQHALWREAIAMVAEGVCDAKTLDNCVKNSFGLRLPVLGPLENADMVGLDLTLDIHKTIMPELARYDRPHDFLEQKVSDGKLGFKNGEGFRGWTETEMNELKSLVAKHLINIQKKGVKE